MSELSATQIPKPIDDNAFERCNEVLWRCILNDDGTSLYGRRGQRQDGVDIVGCRNGDPARIVGIQCKLKGEGRNLREDEVREEVNKALKFEPPLAEFIVVTTAPDDVKLQTLALKLSQSISNNRETDLIIKVFGWASLEREIRRHPEALMAFDPGHSLHATRLEQKIAALPQEILAALLPELLQGINSPTSRVQSEHERQIDLYAGLIRTHPDIAVELLAQLLDALTSEAHRQTKFRVKANIGFCHLELGDEETAARNLIEAWDIDSSNPKASACKAFGLLLRKDWKVLRSFAEARLRIEPDNAELAACYIHSLIDDKSVTDPLSCVPRAVQGTDEVAEAHIRWLMERGDHGAWWSVAISAYNTHPESVRLRDIFACALLDRVIDGGITVATRQLNEIERASVQQSIALYEAKWQQFRDSFGHVSADAVGVPINLICAYRLLGQGATAVRTGREALRRFPEEVEIKEHLALAMAEHGQADEALSLISGLPMSPQIAVIRFNAGMVNEDWQEILVLVSDHLDAFPATERPIASAAATVARAEVSSVENRRSILQDVQGGYAGSTRASVLLAECARRFDFEDLAKYYLQSAVDAFDQGDNAFPCRCAIAYEATAQNRFGSAADVLFGFVDLNHDSIELRILAQALVSDYPIRQRAVRFFDQLSSEVRSLAPFQGIEGALQMSIGVPEKAICLFSAVFAQEPSAENLTYLIRAYIRVGDNAAISSLLKTVDVDYLPGSARASLELCSVLLNFGMSDRALDLGYRVVAGHLEDSTIVRSFLELYLQDRSRPESEDVVRPGVWLKLVESRGHTYEAIVGEDVDRPWGAKGDPSNVLIENALGRTIGDSFDRIHSVTHATESWTIAEIKPRWRQAFEHLSGVFNQKFPSEKGFASVSNQENSVDPILDLVRRKSESDREYADHYLVNNLPISTIASDRPGGSIGFAEYIASIGEDVRVCGGTSREFTAALRLIDQHRRTGVVLDALTAWHISILEIFDIIRERLGSLSIPASELHHLRAMTCRYEDRAGEEEMSLGFRDGQYVRHIMTAEQKAKCLTFARARMQMIEESCEAEPLIVPDGLPRLGDDLTRTPAGESFAPAILAGEDRLLLSEDMMMRQLSTKGYSTKGVWLQPVVLSAMKAGSMSFDAYVDVVVHLAGYRHGPVLFNSRVIRSAYQRDTSDELTRLQALCNYIGTQGADPVSHTKVAAEFINTIWDSGSVQDPRVRGAADLMFEALIARARGS